MPADPLPFGDLRARSDKQDEKIAGKSNVIEFTVSELSQSIKRTVEGRFAYVRLRGEISGYRGPHSSGHCYFTVKDDKAKIDAIIWRGVFSKLKFKPEEGMEVVATGKVSTYPGKSSYQILIEQLEPAGVGALMAQLEARKKKLAAEGLFDVARKKPRPYLPGVVGIITSPTGAVIRDMMHGFEERFPTHVLLWPVRVQGKTCGAEVAAAIAGFNALPDGGPIARPDVLIVARGGGSLEDLWGFNDEIVARAAAASGIPLISAVGHETDWTILDLVADARAPTPTKAAEWAVPQHSELLEKTSKLTARLQVSLRRTLEQRRALLTGVARGLPKLTDLLALPRQRCDMAAQRLGQALKNHTGMKRANLRETAARLSHRTLRTRILEACRQLDNAGTQLSRSYRNGLLSRRQNMEAQIKLLKSLGYQGVLERGFALVHKSDGTMVRRAGEVTKNTDLELEFADGRVGVKTSDNLGKSPKARRQTTAKKRTTPKTPKPRRTPASGQGSLF